MSQLRRARLDFEAGDLVDDSSSSPLYIAKTKDPVDRLKRWRIFRSKMSQSSSLPDLEAGGSRSGDLDDLDDLRTKDDSSSPFYIAKTKQAGPQSSLRKIRAHAQAIRAAYLFKEAGDHLANGIVPPKSSSTGDFLSAKRT